MPFYLAYFVCLVARHWYVEDCCSLKAIFVEFVAITRKIESVKLKLFRCFRTIKISTIISLLNRVELILCRAAKFTKRESLRTMLRYVLTIAQNLD